MRPIQQKPSGAPSFAVAARVPTWRGRRLMLGHKLALVVAAFLLLWAGYLAVAYVSRMHTAVFVTQVNEAGRLRVYSQRIAFLADSCGVEGAPDVEVELCRATLELAIKSYARSLVAIENAPAALLLANDRRTVAGLIEALRVDWLGYRAAAEALLEDGPDAAAARARILQHADLMLDRAETLVEVLVASQLRAQQCRDTVHNILQAAGLLLLIVIAAVGRRQGVLPLRQMVRLARRAGRGDYSGRLDYRADDEIGELASAFNDSNARTQQLIDELAARMAAAERAEAEANALLEAAADGILISAADGRIVRVNREAERIFGYSRQELLGRSVQDLVPDRLRSSHRNYWSGYMAAPLPRVMGRQATVAGLRKNGSEIPLEISLSPARHGEQPSVIAVVRDVTERLRAEADHRRLLTILDTTPDMVAIFKPNRQLVYLNPAGRELLGIGPEDSLEGRSKDELLSPSARRLLREQALPTVLATGVWSGELDLQDARGREVPVSQLLIAHLDEQGQPTHVSAMARDISERRRYEAELLHQATHDQLTGLANRTLFKDRLEQAVYRAERTGKLVALIFIDLDDFKLVNDSMGHAAGDILLREIAGRLQRHLRKADTRARFGGDEFAVILESIRQPEDALAVVAKLAETLHQPITLGEREFVVTTSIGISLYPADATSIDELLIHADTAMYRAKAAGRNSYRLYEPSMNELIELDEGTGL